MKGRVRLPLLAALERLVCLVCFAFPLVTAADTSVTLSLPTNAVFYVDGSTPVTWTSDFLATIGGASLSLDCGENVVVTDSPQCLSQSSGTFLVVGLSVDSTGVACTATVSGAQAMSYSNVSGESYVATTTLVPVLAQSAVSVSPASSSSASPFIGYKSNIFTVSLTPSATNPTGSNLTVAVSCTSASGVWMTTAAFVAGSSAAVQYWYTLSALGGATCSHSYLSTQQQPFSTIADVFFLAQAQTPLVVNNQPSGIYNLATANSFALSVANPLTAGDADLTIQLACSSTGVTGANATDSDGNAATIVMTVGGGNASFLVNTPAVSAGYMSKIACTFAVVGSESSPFDFSSASTTFQFGVGTQATVIISVTATMYPAASTSINQFLFPTPGTIIDSSVTVTPRCEQNGVIIDRNPSPFTWTDDSGSWVAFTASPSLVPGTVRCVFGLSGPDAMHFAPIHDVIITVLPLVRMAVLGVPPSVVAGSTDAATTFDITLLNPQLLYPLELTVGLNCTGATVAQPTLVTPDGLTTTSPPSSVYFASQSTASARFTITVAALSSTEASRPVECTWSLSGNVEAIASGTPAPFSFVVGTLQTLNTSPILAADESSIPLPIGSSTTITINSAAGVINTGLIVSAACNTCGNTGSGTTGATASAADVSNTLTGTFPSSVSGNVFTFLATGTGIVECSFTVGGTDALHFTQPPNIVFNITDANEFAITVSGGVTSPSTGTDSVVLTPTVIPPTGSDQTYTVTVASPGANVDLRLGCTNYGAAITIIAAGGNSVPSSGTVSFTAASVADGTYSFTVTAAEAAAGAEVVCTFAAVTGDDVEYWATPNAFRFYTGPTVALVANLTQVTTFEAVNQPKVTLTTDATTSTAGFTLAVTCPLDGDDDTGNLIVTDSTGTYAASTVGPTGFTLTFAAGSATSAWYYIMANTAGTVVCTYGATDGTDYLRFTAPEPTTMVSTAPTSLLFSGEAYVDGITLAVLPSSQSTATFVLTPDAPVSDESHLTVRPLCSWRGANQTSHSLDVSPSMADFFGVTPVTYTMTQLPTTGTDTTPVGLVVSCPFMVSREAYSANDLGALYFAVGTAGTFDITSTAGFVSYKSTSGQTTLSTSLFTLVPSYCPGSGSFTISATCTNGGSIVFTSSGSGSLTTTAAALGTQNTFRYQSPSFTTGGTANATDVCTFALPPATQYGLYFAPPQSFNITLLDRRNIAFTGLDSSLVAGASVTASIYPTLPAISGGVAIVVTCTGSSNAQQLLTPSVSSFYFLEGDNTPQTFTITAGSSFIAGSCTATARLDADGNGYAYNTVTGTAGSLQTITLSSNVTLDACSSATIDVTLSAPPSGSLSVRVTCLSGATTTVTFAQGVTVSSYTYNALDYGLTDVCTFSVVPGSDAAAIYSTTDVQTNFTSQGELRVTSSPAVLTPSGSSLSVVVWPSMAVPAALTLTVTMTSSSGMTDSSSSSFVASSRDPVTITLAAQTAPPGTVTNWTLTYSLSGEGAAYFLVPPPSSFLLAPTNSLSASLSQSTGLTSGQTVNLTLLLGSVVTVALTADVQCRNLNTSTIILSTSVPLAVGDVTSPPLAMVLAANTSAAYVVECGITAGGTGATLITLAQSLTFSFGSVAEVSSSTGGAGAASSTGESSTGGSAGTTSPSELAGASSTGTGTGGGAGGAGGLSSTGGVGISSSTGGSGVAGTSSTGSATGGAGGVTTTSTGISSTGDNLGDCALCAAIGAASVPSLLLYAVLIAVVITVNQN